MENVSRKNNRLVKPVALFFAAVFAFGSCAPSASDTESEATEGTTETAAETETLDLFPDKNFGGRDYTILCRDTDTSFDSAQDGDVVNDAVYKRNLTVEERYNVKINVVKAPTDTIITDVRATVSAGDSDYDIVGGHMSSLASLSLEDLLYNLYGLDNIDTSQPWYSAGAADSLTVNKKLYMIISMLSCQDMLAATWCMFGNKTLISDYKLDDPYTVVNSGGWTLDYLKTATKDIFTDLNSNGTTDKNDFVGYTMGNDTVAAAFFYSLGGQLMKENSEGVPELVVDNDRTVEIVDKFYDFLHSYNGVLYGENYLEAEEMFRDSRAVYYARIFGSVFGFNDLDDDFAVLPLVKFDEAQESYRTITDASGGVFGIPLTVADIEFSSFIFEVMSAAGYEYVMPAYYETALQVKYTRDDESIKMIDLIKDSVVYDFGYLYDMVHAGRSGGFGYFLGALMSMKSPSFTTYYAKMSKSVTKYYDEILSEYLS